MKTVHNQHVIGGTLEIHPVWNDVPRGTMDEVSSHVRLNLPSVYNGKAAE